MMLKKLKRIVRTMFPETCPHAQNTAARVAWYLEKYGKVGLDRLVVDDARANSRAIGTCFLSRIYDRTKEVTRNNL